MNNYSCSFFSINFLQLNSVITPLHISCAAEKKSKAILGGRVCDSNIRHINRISGVLIVLISWCTHTITSSFCYLLYLSRFVSRLLVRTLCFISIPHINIHFGSQSCLLFNPTASLPVKFTRNAYEKKHKSFNLSVLRCHLSVYVARPYFPYGGARIDCVYII